MSEAQTKALEQTQALDTIAMNKLLRLRNGRCRRCGKHTIFFFGKYNCDECVEWWKRMHGLNRKVICFQNSSPEKEDKGAYAIARAWRPLTSNVYIAGRIGAGKSYLAECMAFKVRELGRMVSSMTALQFCDVIASRLNPRSGVGIGTVVGPPLLVLDDVDKAPWSPLTMSWLWQVLDVRRNNQRSTIFTTNYAYEELVKHLQQFVQKNDSLARAIMDRLQPFITITLLGDSLRKREATLQEAAGDDQLVWEMD